ncbi:Protein bunched, class 2/F/G isoform [Armadillidium nasatum]|uniref:Protein bunched, class 2/F/G isoform n=1 Tax=Armadillidium nasatum TaxID=96803 RepID=A0A5N5SYW5_9CRUS|nr:Protein bunched, class 2/F/G isoform [Armadillidium nasatum]
MNHLKQENNNYAMSHTNYTSETLRLEPNNSICFKDNENTNNPHLQAAVLSASQGCQKKSSFQITSIRPTSRSSNDGADDTDPDEPSDVDTSRFTADIDQETPSYSEEYSKSEEMILGTGPVIPTSSQYGITALVQQTSTGGMMTARLPQGVTVNVTEGGLALAKADGEPDDLDNWQKRFKIVKIDSTEPFKRGRWICLDFMDSPALSSTENKSDEMPPNLVVSNVVLADGDSSEGQAHRFVQIPLSLSSTVQYQPIVSHTSTQFTPQSQTTVPVVSTSQVPSVQLQSGVQFAPSGGPPMQVVPPSYSGPQPPQGSVHPTSCGQVSTTASSQPTIPSNVHSKPDIQHTSGINTTSISQGTVPIGIQPIHPSHSISSSHSQSTASPAQHQHVAVNQPPSSGQKIANSHAVTNSQPSTIISQLSSLSSTAPSTTIQATSYTSLPGTGVTNTPATTPAHTQLNLASGQSPLHTDQLHQILPPTGSTQASASNVPQSGNVEVVAVVSQGNETSASNTAAQPAATAAAGSEEPERYVFLIEICK